MLATVYNAAFVGSREGNGKSELLKLQDSRRTFPMCQKSVWSSESQLIVQVINPAL